MPPIDEKTEKVCKMNLAGTVHPPNSRPSNFYYK